MKLRPLHTKNNFLQFVSLLILVLGAAVGVVLATQKEKVSLDSSADESKQCNLECNAKTAAINSMWCFGDWKYKCVYKTSTQRYVLEKNFNCASQGNKTCKQLVGKSSCAAECVENTTNTGCEIDGSTSCSGKKMLMQCVDGELLVYKDCSLWNQECSTDTKSGEPACVDKLPTPTPTPSCVEGREECSEGFYVLRCVNGVLQKKEDCLLSGKKCVSMMGWTGCVSSSFNPKTPTPTPAGYCRYDCLTRYECNNEGGNVTTGKCNYTGEVCCKF